MNLKSLFIAFLVLLVAVTGTAQATDVNEAAHGTESINSRTPPQMGMGKRMGKEERVGRMGRLGRLGPGLRRLWRVRGLGLGLLEPPVTHSMILYASLCYMKL